MVFVAQLWKYNYERLENKNGDWMYMGETLIAKRMDLPEGSSRSFGKGQVIRNTLGSVLKANLDSKGMHLKLWVK